MGEIRAQYHIRHVGGHALIREVRKLVKAAADLPVEQVFLEDIAELNEAYWGGDTGLSVREVADHARLIAAADLSYPILLCDKGRVMDGMHRVAKAWLDGRSTIPARQFVKTPPPDHRDVPLDTLPYD